MERIHFSCNFEARKVPHGKVNRTALKLILLEPGRCGAKKTVPSDNVE
jgi:hypothetical protein